MFSSKDLFPTLKSSSKYQNHRKNVHNEIDLHVPQSDLLLACMKKKEDDEVEMKTIPCSNILRGEECPYKNKCKYAHFKEEWDVKNCHHGTRCNRVTGEKCKNVDSNNVCFYHHPHEDETAFMKRLKIDTSKFKKPSDDELNKSKYYTKMCDSYFLEVPCNKPEGGCTYSHTIEQLVVNKCMFKESCNHVSTDDDGLYQTSGLIVCMFLHTDETMDNYISRVLEPRRKIVIDSNSAKNLEVETQVTSVQECISSSSTENVDTAFREVSKSWADIVEDDEYNKLQILSEPSTSKKVEKLSKKEIKLVEKQVKKEARQAKKEFGSEFRQQVGPEFRQQVRPEIKPEVKKEIVVSSAPQVLIEASEDDLPKILSMMVCNGLTNFKIKVAKN